MRLPVLSFVMASLSLGFLICTIRRLDIWAGSVSDSMNVLERIREGPGQAQVRHDQRWDVARSLSGRFSLEIPGLR